MLLDAASVWSKAWPILFAILFFGVIILIHELGHFTVAKLSGIKVNEFAIGMGPKLLSFGKGETKYSLRLIPMGGYVQMEGEDEASEDERAFNQKPVWKRFLVVIAGAVMNIILGLVLVAILLTQQNLIGTTQIAGFHENASSQSSGLQEGDVITHINGTSVWSDRDISFLMARDRDGVIDFTDKSVTENTRVSYPIDHIKNIVRPISAGPAAKNVIFLSADAFGVLPPVSILTPEQTQYYFLSGFTAKLAGTERGITEPTPTFSACFGQAFLELHPTKYAEELVKKMKMSGAKAYLVNTGWNGTGKRISIKDTRGIIDAILNGDINNVPTKKIPYFDFEVPTVLNGVDTGILDPRDTYADASQWEEKAKDLAGRFIKNFAKYEGNEHGKALVSAGPQL